MFGTKAVRLTAVRQCLTLHRTKHLVSSPVILSKGNDPRPLVSGSTTTMAKRFYAKGKSKGGNKNKGKATIDDLLDELDDDDDEDLVQKKPIDAFAGTVDTEAGKFLDHHNKHKHGKIKDKMAKGSKHRSAHTQNISYEELQTIINVEDYWSSLQEVLDDLKNHYVHHLTIRSANALDDLPVELEGDKYPLHELASISKRDPKRLIIDISSFPQASVSIVSAIRESGMNLNPQQEGTKIYVPIPKVTKEYREKLVKGAKLKLNECKDDLRKVQNKALSKIGDQEILAEGHVDKDKYHATREVLHAMVEHFSALGEQMMQTKQKDLTGK